MSTATTTLQVLTITTALLSSGSILTLSLFDIPTMQSQPASRSLPAIRWLFSRGSHIFPAASALSATGFAYLAYLSRPATASLSLSQVLRHGRVPGYIAAAVLAIGIGPFTRLMIPTNFRLIELNEKLGGARSEKSARGEKVGGRSVDESVGGEGQAPQFTDLSGPQTRTGRDATGAEEREVQELLGKFGRLNAVRGALIGAGGIVGLFTALA